MARAKFDRTEVIAAATELFGRRGYSAASMQEVFKVTGLQPGSLYNAFGSKDGLFEESIRYFSQSSQCMIRERFEQSGDELVAICQLLLDFVQESMVSAYNSCFLVKAQLEMASIGNVRLANIVAEQLQGIQDLITEALAKHFEPELAKERAVSVVLHIFGLRVYGYMDRSAAEFKRSLEAGLPWLPWEKVSFEATAPVVVEQQELA